MVGPDYRLPETRPPSKWAGAKDHRNVPPPVEWWKVFGDPTLDRLIREAAAFNLDVKQTGARIAGARAQRHGTLAAGLPSLDARGNISQRHNDFQTGGGATPFNPASGGFFGGNTLIDIVQAGFDVQWEIDPAGGLFRALEAADASIEAEQNNRRAALVSLMGEVARTYVEIRANQRQVAITRDNLRTQEDTLNLTRARARAGLNSEQEVAQQTAQAEFTRSQLPAFEMAAKQAVYALAVLLAKPPGTMLYLLETEGRVPEAPVGVAADLPSELLRRRPDVMRAERQLASATAQLGEATADLYPKINLTGFLGMQNTKLSDFSPIGKSWAMGAGIKTPIFNWGRIRANIDNKDALREQTLLAYQATVLNAFKEVEDALIAYAKEQERRAALTQSVDASALAVKLSEERYIRGLTAFLDVLETQRALYQAQSNLVASNARVATSLVALYKALGGGWQAVEPEPPKSEG
jgi:NodT family efflux transporter outer membrane factor (OMF) lipoprotein